MNCEVCHSGPLTQQDALTISMATEHHVLCGLGGCIRSFFKGYDPGDKRAFPPTAAICEGCEVHPAVASVRERTRRAVPMCGRCLIGFFFERSGVH